MTQKKIGYALAVTGFILVVAGIAGLLFDRPAVVKVPSPTPELPTFTESYENPERATYTYKDPGVPAPGAQAFHTVTRITAYGTKNPKTGAPADALRLELAAVPDIKFTVLVLVEAERPPATGTPENIYGLQWRLAFADGKFTKSAQRVGPGGITDEPSDHFNARYEGLKDRAEVEFYGPPGTRYHAVLITDGDYCSLILPKPQPPGSVPVQPR